MSRLPIVLADLARWYAMTTLALGARTGLLDALLDGGGTADELASAAGVDHDNARRWAEAMVVAGYARMDGGRFKQRRAALGLFRGGFPFDLRAAVEITLPIGGMLPRIERAVRDGAGIDSAEIQESLGSLPERVNGPLYEMYLVTDWMAGHPEVEARLRSGIDVAEIGPGGGQALRILAAAFPASRFTGYDLDPRQVDRANGIAAAAGLANLRFEARDGAALPASSLDLVLVFDVFHHFTAPDAILDGMRAALRVGGELLVAEPTLSGDPTVDAADAFGIIVYGSSLLYCYQESKAAGNPGLGATWAARGLAPLLEQHGFDIAATRAVGGGYDLVQAVRRAD